jgi:hypothetical protein
LGLEERVLVDVVELPVEVGLADGLAPVGQADPEQDERVGAQVEPAHRRSASRGVASG